MPPVQVNFHPGPDALPGVRPSFSCDALADRPVAGVPAPGRQRGYWYAEQHAADPLGRHTDAGADRRAAALPSWGTSSLVPEYRRR